MQGHDQYQSSWHSVTAAIASVTEQALPEIVGGMVSASGGQYLAGRVASIALSTLIYQARSESDGVFQSVKADTAALVRAPYLLGISLLEDAEATTNADRRRALIDKAIDEFRRASAVLEARGEAEDMLGRAHAECYVANCCAMLGYREEARSSYQRAHTAAVRYLLADGGAVRTAWSNYVKHHDQRWEIEMQKHTEVADLAKGVAEAAGKNVLAKAGTLGVLAAGMSAVSWPVLATSAAVGVGGYFAISRTQLALAVRGERRAWKAFVEGASPVLEFTDSLQQLQTMTPDLTIEFAEQAPTLTTLPKMLEAGT